MTLFFIRISKLDNLLKYDTYAGAQFFLLRNKHHLMTAHNEYPNAMTKEKHVSARFAHKQKNDA